MTTAADRRRRLFAIVGALLVAAVWLVVAPRAARAITCPVLNPSCNVTSTTEVSSTSTSFEVSSTTATLPRTTSTTARRRTTVTTDVTSTSARSVSVTTVKDLLVPGDGTQGAESTTTTLAKVATAKGGFSDNQLIGIIVGGLGLIAVVMALLTWRYWRATRPVVEEPRAARGRPA